MPRRSLARLRWPLLLMWPILLWPAAADAQDPSAGDLVCGRWRASAFGREAGGAFCLVRDDAGFLRLDLSLPAQAPDPGGDLAPGEIRAVQEWRGDGYCVVMGEPGEGTLGPWREAWRRLDRPAGIWLALAGAHLHGQDLPAADLAAWGAQRVPDSRAPGPRPLFRRGAAGPTLTRYRVPRLARPATADDFGAAPSVEAAPPATGFRSGQVAAAAGRGREGETLTLVRRPDGLTLSSSRRPGAVRLQALTFRALDPLPAEVFVPLWPLTDVLDADGKN